MQYASNQYVALLREHEIQISMSRAGNPYDNSAASILSKPLKRNEIYFCDYEDIDDARRHIGRSSTMRTTTSAFTRARLICLQRSLKRN